MIFIPVSWTGPTTRNEYRTTKILVCVASVTRIKHVTVVTHMEVSHAAARTLFSFTVVYFGRKAVHSGSWRLFNALWLGSWLITIVYWHSLYLLYFVHPLFLWEEAFRSFWNVLHFIGAVSRERSAFENSKMQGWVRPSIVNATVSYSLIEHWANYDTIFLT